MSDLFTTLHKPDVLSCLSDLSNDEVFTPPNIVNDMLDLLPKDLFENPNITFLDPVCKSGVFLREIAKRLIKGLEPIIPDLQERLEHIFHKQLYGIAITELTSLLSRRSVYCSKYPNSPYSVSQFDDIQGNIRYKQVEHEWIKGKCCFCGATESEYGTTKREGMESHAYEFIHTVKPQEIFKMKFDVIIGNPPYQLNVGSGGKGSGTAIPIYNLFVQQAKKLNPRYLVMIIPSRWFSGGRGLDSFRQAMLNDRHLSKLVDFMDSKDCFPGVDIAGGVCYFLWDREKTHDTCQIVNTYKNESTVDNRNLNEFNTFIRNNTAIHIVKKVLKLKEITFNKVVSPVSLYGLNTNVSLTDNGDIAVRHSGGISYCNKNSIRAGFDTIDKYKVYISAASYDHAGQPDKDGKRRVLSIIDILKPKTICTSTYIVVKVCDNVNEAEHLVGYLKTKFVRFLLAQICISQHLSRDTFAFVPMQDFSKHWTDEELYKKYNLTQDEIDFIESMIRPMD